jgi:hypothetical protein
MSHETKSRKEDWTSSQPEDGKPDVVVSLTFASITVASNIEAYQCSWKSLHLLMLDVLSTSLSLVAGVITDEWRGATS